MSGILASVTWQDVISLLILVVAVLAIAFAVIRRGR